MMSCLNCFLDVVCFSWRDVFSSLYCFSLLCSCYVRVLCVGCVCAVYVLCVCCICVIYIVLCITRSFMTLQRSYQQMSELDIARHELAVRVCHCFFVCSLSLCGSDDTPLLLPCLIML